MIEKFLIFIYQSYFISVYINIVCVLYLLYTKDIKYERSLWVTIFIPLFNMIFALEHLSIIGYKLFPPTPLQIRIEEKVVNFLEKKKKC